MKKQRVQRAVKSKFSDETGSSRSEEEIAIKHASRDRRKTHDVEAKADNQKAARSDILVAKRRVSMRNKRRDVESSVEVKDVPNIETEMNTALSRKSIENEAQTANSTAISTMSRGDDKSNSRKKKGAISGNCKNARGNYQRKAK